MLQPAVQRILKHTFEFRHSCDVGPVIKGKGKGKIHSRTGHEDP
jgi:hypothetical protein